MYCDIPVQMRSVPFIWHLGVYMYTYTYIYMYSRTCTHRHGLSLSHTHTDTHMNTYIHVRLTSAPPSFTPTMGPTAFASYAIFLSLKYVCVCVNMYVCMNECVRIYIHRPNSLCIVCHFFIPEICMYVCMYTYIYIYIYIYIHTYVGPTAFASYAIFLSLKYVCIFVYCIHLCVGMYV